ncbi:MAG: YecA family protein [Anaerolineae bacterium]
MTESIGRNDPCPCGSGKKYKHCCLRKAAGRRTVQHPARRGRHLSEADDLQPLTQLIEEIAAYEAMGEEIDAAVAALVRHRPAFEALMEDGQAIMKRTHQLFADARFAPFHCTADEVQQAFEEVGYPGDFVLNADQEADRMSAAILHVAAQREDQLSIARKLMMMLPEYVAEQRYMDAWIILFSVHKMTEAPDQSNPFLFEMFGYGNDALAERIVTQQKALLQHLGLEQEAIGAVSFDEAEALMQAQTADPAKNAALEAYFAAHPELHRYVEAELWDMERRALLLLEREDAECLYLDPEEVMPYMVTLMERLHPLETQAREALEKGESPRPETVKAMSQMVMDVARTMTPEIFTAERIARLRIDMKTYQHDLSQAGENRAAALAHAAGITLQREEPLDENPLLIAICFVSLREMLMAISYEAQARQDGATEEEQAL